MIYEFSFFLNMLIWLLWRKKNFKHEGMHHCAGYCFVYRKGEKKKEKEKSCYYYYLSLWSKIFVIVSNVIHRVAFNKIMVFIKIHNITVSCEIMIVWRITAELFFCPLESHEHNIIWIAHYGDLSTMNPVLERCVTRRS